MANWWENGSNSGGVSSTWWGGGNGGAAGTCRGGCEAPETKCTFGCTDPTAPNYDPLAQCDDGSCDIITYDDCGIEPPPPPLGDCYVPDDVFEQRLIDLGHDTGTIDDFVNHANVNTVTSLDVHSTYAQWSAQEYINDLTGIECFTALEHLNIQSNHIANMDFSSNTALTSIFAYNNQGANTTWNLSQNTALITLKCGLNWATDLDLSANTALEYLDCQVMMSRTNLDVSQNTALTFLDCHYGPLTSLDVSNNTALDWLSCSNNKLISLDVSNNTVLTHLNCRNQQAQDLISLDLRNGNNANMSVAADGNNLTVVYVDDLTIAANKVAVGWNNQTGTAGGWWFDSGVTFSL